MNIDDIMKKRLIDLTAEEHMELFSYKIKPMVREAAMEVMSHVNDDLISRKEARAILGIGESTMSEWIRQGKLNKLGNSKEGEYSRAECKRKQKFGRNNKEAA